MTSDARLERYEERGFFLSIPFPGENSPTVLYVADRDFENLHDIVEDEDNDWTDLRDEIRELLDHSGHEGDHEFTESLVRSLMTVIREQEPPEDTEIEDPLDDLNPDNPSNGN